MQRHIAYAVLFCLEVWGCKSHTLGAVSLAVSDMSIAAPVDGTVVGFLKASDSQVTFALVSTTRKGSVSLDDARTGSFRYTPNQTAAGSDQFSYIATQGSTQSNVATVRIAISGGSLTGRLTYDAVPSKCDALGACALDYNQTLVKPIRNAQVSLLDAHDLQHVLSQTVSDASGHYKFAAGAVTEVRVAVQAQMRVPAFSVRDNTQGDAGYVLLSDAVNRQVQHTLDLHAASGWTGTGYGDVRAAAPFAILDTLYSGALAFWAERPAVQFAPLVVYWSSHNIPAAGSLALGEITTSFWNGAAIYLLGAADADTDEYDTHVIAHEWGHYLESTLGRSDSPGGPHGEGDLLDMRVAFSEGWGDAESAMVLYPDTRYVDTNGAAQQDGFSFDLASTNSIDPTPGWFSEASVAGLLFNLFKLEGLGTLYDVLTGPHRTTPALTSIFSFVSGLKSLRPEHAAQIDALVMQRGIDAIVDPWGSGESHDGGMAWVLPIYQTANINGGTQVRFVTPNGKDLSLQNKLGSNRFVHFVGDGKPIDVASLAAAQVNLSLFSPGCLPVQRRVTCTTMGHCLQSFSDVATQAQVDYVLNLQSADTVAEELACSVSLSH